MRTLKGIAAADVSGGLRFCVCVVRHCDALVVVGEASWTSRVIEMENGPKIYDASEAVGLGYHVHVPCGVVASLKPNDLSICSEAESVIVILKANDEGVNGGEVEGNESFVHLEKAIDALLESDIFCLDPETSMATSKVIVGGEENGKQSGGADAGEYKHSASALAINHGTYPFWCSTPPAPAAITRSTISVILIATSTPTSTSASPTTVPPSATPTSTIPYIV